MSFELDVEELTEQAKEAANDVVEGMPEDLTPEEEIGYLTSTLRVFSMASAILQQVVANKKPVTRH